MMDIDKCIVLLDEQLESAKKAKTNTIVWVTFLTQFLRILPLEGVQPLFKIWAKVDNPDTQIWVLKKWKVIQRNICNISESESNPNLEFLALRLTVGLETSLSLIHI